MCGIFSIFDRDLKNKKKLLDISFNLLQHRGPDSKNQIFINDNLAFGHHRLSVIDLDKRSSQPMRSLNGRYTIIFNGEIYNFKELKKKINFHNLKTESDTEVLLMLWEKYGPSSLDMLKGMFAFIIFDELKEDIYICRDRFGIKPIYYFKSENFFIFSSEIKPILSYIKYYKPNLKAIKSYLVDYLYDHTNETFFDNILKVEQGSFIKINIKSQEWKIKKWYDLSSKIKNFNKLNYIECKTELKKLIDKSITEHLVSDTKIGLNISGGIDSSILSTFTLNNPKVEKYFHQNYPHNSEKEWIRELGAIAKTKFVDLNANKIFSIIEEITHSQEEPFGGIMVCGFDYLYKDVKKNNIKVMIDGNGLDELLCGYSKYLNLNTVNSKTIDGTNFDNKKFISKKFIENIDSLRFSSKKAFKDKSRNASLNDLLFSKVPRTLRFNDKISMKSSIELRVPFLDHELVEFSFSIPSEYLVINNLGKYPARDILYDKTKNKELCFNQKRSIQSPQNYWITGEWYSKIYNMLFNSSFIADSELFNIDEIQEYFIKIKNKKIDNSFHIWQWINLELWFRKFIH